jgi:hypothetical protein
VSYEERVADDRDPLRGLLEAARRWRVPPTVFIRKRTVNSAEWTDDDTMLALALENYESGLCPGGPHVLAETSKPEHADAYRPDTAKRLRCHHCKASALLAEVTANEEDTAGVMVPLMLDPDVVALNLLPVPPLPPELAGL